VHPVEFEFKQQLLGWSKRFALSGRAKNVFDVHRFSKYVIDNSQVCKRVIFLGYYRPCHYLCPCLPNSRVGCDGAPPFVVNFCTLLEKHFSKDILLFRVRVIVLDIVVVGLVKYACAVMIAVGILIPNSSHLILKLSLRRHAANTHSTTNGPHTLTLGRTQL